MTCDATNIKIDPVDVDWDIEEQWEMTAVADVASSLDATFIALSDDVGTVGFWIDVDDSGTTIPAGASALDRAVEITTVTAGMTATQVAGVVATAINADSKFTSVATTTTLLTTASTTADVTAWADGDTGFTFKQCQEGGNLDLGNLDGDIDSTFEEALFNVTSHQTGTTVVASLRQGNSAEITTILQETTTAKLNQLFAKAGGGSVTPGGGTEVFGWGSAKQGTNALVQARRLILKPVNASDDTENLTFWKAYPKPGSLVFSGENPKLLTVTWQIFRDDNIATAIDLFAFGDQTQSGLTS